MIAKILGKIGLPLLVKYLGKALRGMNCTVAQEAGQMLGSVDDAIQNRKISLEELKEANRHVEKLQEIEAGLDDKTLNTIHQTIRQELSSEDRFVRFWRPAFGYSVALAWLMNMGTICYVVISDNPRAPEIIAGTGRDHVFVGNCRVYWDFRLFAVPRIKMRQARDVCRR